MKKLLGLAVLSALLVGCSGKPQDCNSPETKKIVASIVIDGLAKEFTGSWLSISIDKESILPMVVIDNVQTLLEDPKAQHYSCKGTAKVDFPKDFQETIYKAFFEEAETRKITSALATKFGQQQGEIKWAAFKGQIMGLMMNSGAFTMMAGGASGDQMRAKLKETLDSVFNANASTQYDVHLVKSASNENKVEVTASVFDVDNLGFAPELVNYYQALKAVQAAPVAPAAPAPASAPAASAPAASAPAASAPAASANVSPSFDCGKASNGTEKLICSDNQLAQLDVELAAAYQKAKSSTADPDKLKADQIAWVKMSRQCGDKQCLEQAYKMRISQLNK